MFSELEHVKNDRKNAEKHHVNDLCLSGNTSENFQNLGHSTSTESRDGVLRTLKSF